MVPSAADRRYQEAPASFCPTTVVGTRYLLAVVPGNGYVTDATWEAVAATREHSFDEDGVIEIDERRLTDTTATDDGDTRRYLVKRRRHVAP